MSSRRRKKKGKQGQKPVDRNVSPGSLPWRRLLPLFIALMALLAYSNSFSKAFVLDDDQNIEDNLRIRDLDNLDEILAVQRPLVELSLAINYALGESDASGKPLPTAGWHAFNLLVHIITALLLYGIVRRTLQLPKMREQFGAYAPWFALVVSVLWVVHPLQTESVTYVIQRGESMMGLLYLLAIYCVIRGSQESGYAVAVWYVGAVVAALAGMSSKAIIITLPAVLLLYDRIFLSRSVAELVARRFHVHVGVMIALLTVGTSVGIIGQMVEESGGVRSQEEVDRLIGRAANRMEYYRTQPEILLHYGRLTYWPDQLCLDYKWTPSTDAARIAWTTAGIALIVGLTGLLLWRVPTLGFPLAAAAIILSPTCAHWRLELCFEHRMYLSLAGVIAVTVFVGWWALQRLFGESGLRLAAYAGLSLAALAAIALTLRTIIRNEDYASRTSMYQSVVEVRPQNPRGHYNLANPLSREAKALKSQAGRLRKQGKAKEADQLLAQADQKLARAIEAYEEAVRLFPRYTDAMINLGLRYEERGQYDDSIRLFEQAVEIKPRHKIGLYNLGRAWLNMGIRRQQSGDRAGATEAFEKAVPICRRSMAERPKHTPSLYSLGESLRKLGRYAEAEQPLRSCIKVDPKHARALRSLGDVLLRSGNRAEALSMIQRAVEIQPGNQWGQQLLRQAGGA